MKNKAQDDILDDQEYPIIRTLNLFILEIIIVVFTIVSITFIFAPLTYKIVVTSPTAPTEGDKIGLVFLALVSVLKLLPFTFVFLFFKTSRNPYLDKTTAFKPSYFRQLQQYSNYVAILYLLVGFVMSFLYGFSDYRTIYTSLMLLTGVATLIYTTKTYEYINN